MRNDLAHSRKPAVFVSIGLLGSIGLLLGATAETNAPPSRIGAPDLVEALGLLCGTNTAFSARVTLETSKGDKRRASVSKGLLLFLGGKVLFEQTSAADPASGVGRRAGALAGPLTFIKLPQEDVGYVVSEAISGYATVPTARTGSTEANLRQAELGTEKACGYSCRKCQVVVPDGPQPGRTYTVWRAVELQGLPVKTAVVESGISNVLTLSDIRLEKPAAALFSPPDGFTRYETVEAMLAELALRRSQQLGRRGSLDNRARSPFVEQPYHRRESPH